eukprot:scaffold520785_cov37-Prasinocladus_malaysianus.AAC.1
MLRPTRNTQALQPTATTHGPALYTGSGRVTSVCVPAWAEKPWPSVRMLDRGSDCPPLAAMLYINSTDRVRPKQTKTQEKYMKNIIRCPGQVAHERYRFMFMCIDIIKLCFPVIVFKVLWQTKSPILQITIGSQLKALDVANHFEIPSKVMKQHNEQ